jgi:hypothetical protein
MIFETKFSETNQSFRPDFRQIQTASDGGYERGYSAGYAEGLATRTYETWTITLTDGTVIEKEVALL